MVGDPSPSRPIRLADVALSVGVSRATASLVMRNSPRVAEATRERVLAAADRLGYVYNRGAASLRMSRTQMVGLIVTDITNSFFAEIAIGIEAVLAEAGYIVLLANTFDDVDRQEAILSALAENRADGVVLVPAIGTKAVALGGLRSSRTPFVLATRYLVDVDAPYVGPDDAAGAGLAARHLLDHGCRSAAYMGGPLDATARRDRSRGFLSAFSAGGAEVDRRWCVDFEPTTREGYTHARRLLAEGPLPEGLLCHSDTVAFGVLRALHEAGMQAPSGCRIIGFEDLDMARMSIPSLSSLSVDPVELGRLTGRTLLRQMRGLGGASSIRTLPTPQLRTRESCGCLPSPDVIGHSTGTML